MTGKKFHIPFSHFPQRARDTRKVTRVGMRQGTNQNNKLFEKKHQIQYNVCSLSKDQHESMFLAENNICPFHTFALQKRDSREKTKKRIPPPTVIASWWYLSTTTLPCTPRLCLNIYLYFPPFWSIFNVSRLFSQHCGSFRPAV